MNKHWYNMAAVCGAWCLLLSGTAGAQEKSGEASFLDNLNMIGNYYERIQSRMGRQPLKPDETGSAAGSESDSSGKAAPTTRALVLPGVPQNDAMMDLFMRNSMGRRDESGVGRPGYRDAKRNPFAPTRQILASIRGEVSGQSVNFQPLQEETVIPRMKLKGLINEGGNKIAALLEIENAGTHIVREGDTVGLYETGTNSVIRIRKINRLNLVVEAGSLGQVLIVR